MQNNEFRNPLSEVSACDSTQEHGVSNTHVMSLENQYNTIYNSISPENKINVFFDYIKFTLPVKVFDENGELIRGSKDVLIQNKLEEIKEIFGASESLVFMQDYGGSGYKNCLSIADYINIFFAGGKQTRNKNDDETIMIEIKGQGCRFIETELKLDLLKLIQTFKKRFMASFTRIDFSCDLFTEEYFTLKKLFNKIINRHCSCPSSQFDLRIKTLDSAAKYLGQTLYVGSQASDRLLCIYDKKQEQIAKYENADIWLDTWIRFELRFKQEWAKRLAMDLCNDDVDIRKMFQGLLFEFLDIKTKSRNLASVSNASHLPTWKPWSDFLDNVGKIKLTNQGTNESNFVTKSEWHKSNVSPFETQLFLFNPNNFENVIYENIGNYIDKFDNKRLAELNVERKKRGYSLLTMQDAIKMIQQVKDKYCIDDYINQVEEEYF